MSDIENELRELFDEDAARAPRPGRPSRPLLRRTRRRQAALVFASVVTVAAVVVGSIAGLQALLGKSPEIQPASGPSRTTTLVGLTITTPQSWSLVDLWPLATSIATSSQGSAGAGDPIDPTGPSPIPVPTGLPVFQLSNYDVGLASVCGSGGSVPAEGALLYVALDSDRMQGLTEGPRPPGWPVELGEGVTDGPCGPGLYANWQSGTNAFFAFAVFGSGVGSANRQQLLDSFNGMSVQAVDLAAPGIASPAYVIASGVAGIDPWNMLVSPVTNGRGPEIAIESTAKGPSGNGGSISDITVPEGKDLEGAIVTQGDSTFDWGAVSDRVARIEVRLDDGRTIAGDIVPIPSSLDAPFEAFVVVVPNATAGHIVALDANGGELASEGFIPQTAGLPSCAVAYPPVGNVSPGSGGNAMETESSLRNALAAAKTFYADCNGYSGFDPRVGVGIEPSLSYDTSSTATPGVISIRDVSDTTILLVTATADGAPYCIADDAAAGLTTYGTVDAQTVAECPDRSWP